MVATTQLINTFMKIRELLESISDSYLNHPDDIDAVFNKEALNFSKQERVFRKKQGVGVIRKPRKEDVVFSTEPDPEQPASPGRRTLDWVEKKILKK